MKIVVCGLGYVGTTAGACLVQDGHRVVGVDVNRQKVDQFAAGIAPVSEPRVGDMLAAGRAGGRLGAATAIGNELDDADLAIVCVGTPSTANGSLDLDQIVAVAGEIGRAVRGRAARARPLMVVFRSTMPPGSMDGVVMPALVEAAGAAPGGHYEVAFNPEFLRESTAVADYYAPAKIVVGERAAGAARRLYGLYDGIKAPLFEMPFAAAELVKLTDNAFHALKVAFGNEIGRLALALGVAPDPVADAFLADTKLNISPAYLRPGGPFGGSCLPKDVRALQYRAKEVDLEMPVINSILGSNRMQVQHAIDDVLETGRKRVGLLGFSFKAGTDDLRESPLVILAEALLGKGLHLRIYDRNVSLARLIGANKEYIEEQIPHLSSLLVPDVDRVIEESEVIVVGNASEEFVQAVRSCRPDQIVIDLVRLPIERAQVAADYRGICW